MTRRLEHEVPGVHGKGLGDEITTRFGLENEPGGLAAGAGTRFS
jgi:hypothetical protein